MQCANVVIGREELVFVVVIGHPEHNRAIAPGARVQIAEHVVPRSNVGARHAGVPKNISGLRRQFVRQARRIRKTRIAQRDHQVIAVQSLRLLLSLQSQLEGSGRRIRLQDRWIKWRAEEQPIQGKEAQAGQR
jgi:hypothetical protein